MQTGAQKIRVLLVDDHEIVRAGLKTVLESSPEIEVVGEADTRSGAVTETARLKPDVVLLDIRLPDGSGFEACRKIQAATPDSKVIFLTAFNDDETVFESIASGAEGYLLKDVDSGRLFHAIKSVMAGQSILDPSVTQRVFQKMRLGQGAGPENKLSLLSNQERRIVALVAEGKTNKQIAQEMGLSDKTVKNYLSNALDKLDFNRRSQVAAYYVRHVPSKIK